MSRPEPRTLAIAAVCLALVASTVVAVVHFVQAHGTVTVLANWSGSDQAKFTSAVIRPFEEEYHVHVVYQGTTAESQVLKADVESGTPPDVAVLPGPGELADYAHQGALQQLDGIVDADRFGPAWMPLLDVGYGTHGYWFPVKVDLKSIVWHLASLPRSRLAATAAEPGQWCLGMGSDATSGWPATDWIEDILLQQSGYDVYQRWATGRLPWQDPRVRQAWQTWQRMVGAGQTAWARRALETRSTDASLGVTAHPPTCALEHQGSYVRAGAPWTGTKADFTPSSQLIQQANRSSDAWEVSGDLAAMFRRSPEAEKFIRYLASAGVQRRWSLQESGFSADTQVPGSAYGSDEATRRVADTLREPTAIHCFDASDAMPPALRDAFVQAALAFLAHPETLQSRLRALDTVSARQQAFRLHSVCDRA